MIHYNIDKDKTYDIDIMTNLRSYNKKFTGVTEFKQSYIYIIDNHQLIGALTVSCFWNWATIGDVFYKDVDVLKAMVDKAWHTYKFEIFGVKFFSPVKERFEDFLKVGFKHTKTIHDMGYSSDFYYADLYEFDKNINNKFDIIMQTEEHETYHKIANHQFKSFYDKHNIKDKNEDLAIVALDDKQFAGGVSIEIYDDTIYIGRLIVNEAYREKDIGTHLMLKVEEEAKQRNIKLLQLGTCEFQARSFYEKLGYEVVYTRENNPKGYKSYTMIKRITKDSN